MTAQVNVNQRVASPEKRISDLDDSKTHEITIVSPEKVPEINMDLKQEINEETKQESKKSNKFPVLFVDVNIGNGKVDRVVIYEGDTAERVAREFAAKNGK